jgi:hypothetical protein
MLFFTKNSGHSEGPAWARVHTRMDLAYTGRASMGLSFVGLAHDVGPSPYAHKNKNNARAYKSNRNKLVTISEQYINSNINASDKKKRHSSAYEPIQYCVNVHIYIHTYIQTLQESITNKTLITKKSLPQEVQLLIDSGVKLEWLEPR